MASSAFDATKKRLDIGVDFKAGSRFACPDCKRDGCPVHDTTEKTWRRLDFFQHQAFLTARVPRITCGKCGVRQVDVPWSRKGSVFTLLFEALAMALVTHMPVAAAARLIGEHGNRPRLAPVGDEDDAAAVDVDEQRDVVVGPHRVLQMEC